MAADVKAESEENFKNFFLRRETEVSSPAVTGSQPQKSRQSQRHILRQFLRIAGAEKEGIAEIDVISVQNTVPSQPGSTLFPPFTVMVRPAALSVR